MTSNKEMQSAECGMRNADRVRNAECGVQSTPHSFPIPHSPLRTFLLSVACLMSLVACRSAYAEPPPIDQEVHSFSFEGYGDNGVKQWELQGDTAHLQGEVAFLEKVKVESLERGKAVLTSRKGQYNLRTKQAHLEKDVVVQTEEGTRLMAEELDWDGQKRKVTTERPVTIEKDQVRSQGVGAEAYPDLKQLTLKEKVRVEMGPDLVITSKGPMEIDYASHIAVFQEEVVVRDKEGLMKADRMEVFLDPLSNGVDHVEASGNVEIQRGESFSYSDRASYNAKLKKMTLNGSPRLLLQPRKEDESALTANTQPR